MQKHKILLFIEALRPTERPKQTPIKYITKVVPPRVKRGIEGDRSSSSRAEVKNECSY